MKHFFALIFSISIFMAIPFYVNSASKCLLVMSYHSGYEWNDGIEKAVEQTLKGKCELKKFFMDTKRNKSTLFAVKKANEVKQLIASYQPDVVIASDDNAVKYVVTQYKNTRIPFVFCGVNWTTRTYGFPFKNVAGMVEVVPLRSMLRKIHKSIKYGVFLSSDVVTEQKDFNRMQKVFKDKGISLQGVFVKTMKQWRIAYIKAQQKDFIILSNNSGINDWDKKIALATVNTQSKILTATTYQWMMPYTMIGITKKASEQGNGAARAALKILAGTPASKIPPAINKESNFYVNQRLLDKINIKIDAAIKEKSLLKL